ncbi:MAG: M50 family metallopeptidase [Akkermansia sp.]|nr:M50 family metallopeptidase [Akkermansia sp.]
MNRSETARGVIYFRLWGIPVAIHPMSWVVLAILGGGFGVNDRESLVQVLCFVVAGMLALLSHEFGHALVGRKLGGGDAGIVISGLGGVTRHEHAPRSRVNYFMTVLAGPMASLLFGMLGGVALGLQLGNVEQGVQLSLLLPLPGDMVPVEAVSALQEAVWSGSLPLVMLRVYSTLFLVCFWWSVFNLLPILPLDGGRLLATLLGNNRVVCILGLVICALLGLWCICSGSWFNMMIVGYLGWLNWQFLQSSRVRQ